MEEGRDQWDAPGKISDELVTSSVSHPLCHIFCATSSVSLFLSACTTFIFLVVSLHLRLTFCLTRYFLSSHPLSLSLSLLYHHHPISIIDTCESDKRGVSGDIHVLISRLIKLLQPLLTLCSPQAMLTVAHILSFRRSHLISVFNFIISLLVSTDLFSRSCLPCISIVTGTHYASQSYNMVSVSAVRVPCVSAVLVSCLSAARISYVFAVRVSCVSADRVLSV